MKDSKYVKSNYNSFDLYNEKKGMVNEFTESKNQNCDNILKNKTFKEDEESIKYETPKICNQENKTYSKLEIPESFVGKKPRKNKAANHYEISINNPSISDMEREFYQNCNSIDDEIVITDTITDNVISSELDSSKTENRSKSFIPGTQEEKTISSDDFSISGNTCFLNYGKKRTIYPFNFIKRHYKKFYDKKKINSHYRSQSKPEKEILKKLNLIKNSYSNFGSSLCNSPIHNYLPYCKKNDERYKKNLIQYIRYTMKAKFTVPKSVKATPDIENEKDKNINNKENDFYILKRRKKIYSQSKIFSVEKNIYKYKLIKGKIIIDYKHPLKFKFYFDNDIGFNSNWQKPLIIANGDDDVETDNEILGMAKEKCMEDLAEGIDSWNRNRGFCRNLHYIEKFKKTQDSPTNFDNYLDTLLNTNENTNNSNARNSTPINYIHREKDIFDDDLSRRPTNKKFI